MPLALRILEPALPDGMAVAMMLNAYGQVLLEQGDREAMQYVLRAKGLLERIGGGKRAFLLRESAGFPAPTFTTRTTAVRVPR